MDAHLRFFDTLVAFEIDLWNLLDARVATAHGITLGRLQALRVIADRTDRARVQDVAEQVHITVGAASKLVDRLEADGLVRRAPNPDDRRSSVLRLTHAGQATYKAAAGTLDWSLERLVPAASLDRLTDELGRLRSALLDAPAVLA